MRNNQRMASACISATDPEMRPEADVAIEFITPEIAADMLDGHVNFRPINKAHKEKISRALRSGTFFFNGEAIQVLPNGKADNGQHRLRACIDTEVGFWTVVVRFRKQVELLGVDEGRNRSLGQKMAHLCVSNANTIAAAIRWVLAYELGKLVWYENAPRVRAADHEMIDFMEANGLQAELLDSLHKYLSIRIPVAGREGHRGGPFPSSMASILTMLRRADESSADVFFGSLIDRVEGEPEAMRSIRGTFAAYAARARDLPGQLEMNARVIKAWNAWRGKGSGKIIKLGANEEFPSIEGYVRGSMLRQMKARLGYSIAG